MKAPSRYPGDLHVAYGADAALETPEVAKPLSTPKRRRHLITFAFLEVCLIRRIVEVGFTFDLDVSLNGCADGEQQSHFVWNAFVVAKFSGKDPVIQSLSLEVLLFEPA